MEFPDWFLPGRYSNNLNRDPGMIPEEVILNIFEDHFSIWTIDGYEEIPVEIISLYEDGRDFFNINYYWSKYNFTYQICKVEDKKSFNVIYECPEIRRFYGLFEKV